MAHPLGFYNSSLESTVEGRLFDVHFVALDGSRGAFLCTRQVAQATHRAAFLQVNHHGVGARYAFAGRHVGVLLQVVHIIGGLVAPAVALSFGQAYLPLPS